MDQNNQNNQGTNPQQPSTQQPANEVPNQSQTANQSSTATPDQQTQPLDYIEDVGGDMIGLLDEINEDDALVQKVADEMQLDKEKVRAILTPLLNKLDQGQITIDEIALIMASTIVDEEIDTEEENKDATV
jgi:ubiquinone biosynthesis protein Coq4